MKRLTYIVSDVNRALAFEWVAIHMKKRFNLFFILIGPENSELFQFLNANGIRVIEVSDRQYRSFPLKWLAVLRVLKQESPDIVHTHLWRANLLGLTTAWMMRVKQRIYTRHHALTHYNEHPSGRKWDVLCNLIATDIVAISENIRDILITLDKADVKKIQIIHHGFDLEYFRSATSGRIEKLKNRYKISDENYPVIGVISRYTEWKGIQYTIPAFIEIKKSFPQATLILANAQGDYKAAISTLLSKIPVEAYREVKFEEDLAAFYKLFDVFIHVPIDEYVEAFGQTYVEPLAAGIPSVFTRSGIAREFINHRQNAWVVDFRNSPQIAEAAITILSDADLRTTLVAAGIEAAKNFSLQEYLSKLENLYA